MSDRMATKPRHWRAHTSRHAFQARLAHDDGVPGGPLLGHVTSRPYELPRAAPAMRMHAAGR